MKLPQVEVIWYDGGLQPAKPAGWPAGKNMNDSGGGVIFHGTKDTLICGCYGREPWLLSGRRPDVPKTERRIENAMNGGHEMDWVRACKEISGKQSQNKIRLFRSRSIQRNGCYGCACCKTSGTE